MPRSADHDLELVWKTGIDRPYDSMDNLPLGLLFEETADADQGRPILDKVEEIS